MKTRNLYTLVGALLLSAFVWAQAPQKMSYQAVIRNSSNELLINQNIGIRIGLVCQGDLYPSFEEVHNVTTNSAGVISFQIGGGTSVGFGSFGSFGWSTCPNVQLEINVDPNGGSDYTIFSSQQLLSVPYALYAATSGSGGEGGGTTYTAGSGIQISGGTISAVDNSATNELQNLSLVNGRINLSQSQNMIDLTPYLDNTDNQTLSISGNTLSIARGNSITLPTTASGGSGYWEPIEEGSVDIKNSNTGNVIVGTNVAPTSAKLQAEHDVAYGTVMSIKNTSAAYMKVLSVEENGTSGNPIGCVGCEGSAAIKAKAKRGDAIFASSDSRGAYVQGGSDFYPAMKIATNAPGQVALEIEGGGIKIEGGTAGQILTSDANGVASWQTPVTSEPSPQILSKTGNTINLSGGGGSVNLNSLYNNISTHISSGEGLVSDESVRKRYIGGLEKTFYLSKNAKVIVNVQIRLRANCPYLTICDKNITILNIEIDDVIRSYSQVSVEDDVNETTYTSRVFELGPGNHTIKNSIELYYGGQFVFFGDSSVDTTKATYMDVIIIEE